MIIKSHLDCSFLRSGRTNYDLEMSKILDCFDVVDCSVFTSYVMII